MLRKMALRLPIELFEELQREALREKTSVSNLVREIILHSKISKNDFSNPSIFPQQAPEQSSEENLINLETLFLLREFLFERNAQILKKVDERMEKQFGKDRKKII